MSNTYKVYLRWVFLDGCKAFLTRTELTTEILIQLKQLDNANYSGIDNKNEKQNENY